MELCALTSPAAGNLAGLIGTALLAIAALQALPIARRLYGVTVDLLELAEQRRKHKLARPAPAEGAGAAADAQHVEGLLKLLDEQDAAYEKMLGDKFTTVSAERNRWTGRDTAVTVLGLWLTLGSDFLPLAGSWWCAAPAPAAASAPAGAPGASR